MVWICVALFAFLLNTANSRPRMKRDGTYSYQAFRGKVDDATIKEIVDRHNYYRERVSPPSVNMRLMSWDHELAYNAQRYSNRCIFKSSSSMERDTVGFGNDVGENLIQTAQYPLRDLFYYSIRDWNDQYRHFSYHWNFCVSGRICGNYKQIVWADTYKVGCGATECGFVEDGVVRHSSWMVVCHYHPAGNRVRSKKALLPYKKGEPACSACRDPTDNCTSGQISGFCSNYDRDQILPWSIPTPNGILLRPAFPGAVPQLSINEIVERHNYFRERVSPPATNMRRMTWDHDLAFNARKYSERCRFVHSLSTERQTVKFGNYVGENIINTAKYSENDLFYFTINEWNREYEDYSYTYTECESGKVCGHYTQLVWADSYKVGCGASFCKTVINGVVNNAWVVVCHYYPAGNLIGSQPLAPYKAGVPDCSACSNQTDICTAGGLCQNIHRDGALVP